MKYVIKPNLPENFDMLYNHKARIQREISFFILNYVLLIYLYICFFFLRSTQGGEISVHGLTETA